MKAHKYEVNMKDDTRIALLEQSIGHVNETMLRIEKRFDDVDKRFDKVDNRFDKLEEEIKSVRQLTWSHFRWIMGTLVTLFATIVTVMIKGHVS